MDREINKIKKRLGWLEDLQKELYRYRKDIEASLKKIERKIKKNGN